MKPRPQNSSAFQLFQAHFEQILNPEHPLVCLAGWIDWSRFDVAFADSYSEDLGAPGKAIRLLVGRQRAATSDRPRCTTSNTPSTNRMNRWWSAGSGTPTGSISAADIHAKAVVVWAETGRLARLVSKHRLDIPVAALAPTVTVQRRLCLYYGVRPFLVERAGSADALILQADRIATGAGWANPGDRIVIGLGPQSLSGRETGSIIVHTVGQ